jgi:membrane peptidoglycan carboxypeptidase
MRHLAYDDDLPPLPTSGRGRWRFWLKLFIWTVLLLVIWHFANLEMQTSWGQAQIFSRVAKEIGFTVEPGKNPDFLPPDNGPYSKRLGYTDLPKLIPQLEKAGFDVAWQAHPNAMMRQINQIGGAAIYNEKQTGGLTLYDRGGGTLFHAKYPERVFASYAAIPPLIRNTLLFIENRMLLDDTYPLRNPAVEWDRFGLASIGQIASAINPSINLGGGSTLATQAEKFRHSEGGQTNGAKDKLRQMLIASIRAYRGGPDTMNARKDILFNYLNSTPLTARSGFGEVNGIGDGLWAWFGRDIDEITTILNSPAKTQEDLDQKAIAYKQVLALVLAQRRPSAYLITNRRSLDALANQHLYLLAANGVIDYALRNAALRAPLVFLDKLPPPSPTSFIEQKATNAIRTHLMSLLSLPNFYALDRFDLTVATTLDADAQKRVVDVLKRLGEPDFVKEMGLYGFRLLQPNDDLSKIVYSVVLYESTPGGNVVRVQADNLDRPLDINEGAKLDLGSTAKLRTLVTYLEILKELHDKLQNADRSALQKLATDGPDALTRWVAFWCLQNPGGTLPQILDAAMLREYSGSPAETFFTGGGAHNFENFDHSEDTPHMTVSEAFRHSVNLSFIRMMRDLVNYHIGQMPVSRDAILADSKHPARRVYLERFADQEGSVFLGRFVSMYQALSPDAALQKLMTRARKSLSAQAVLFRTVRPEASLQDFTQLLKANAAAVPPQDQITAAFKAADPGRYSLADRAYLVRLHPMELWLAGYLQAHPKASRSDIMKAGEKARKDSYAWLYTAPKAAQDTRIRILMEEDAFEKIHARWVRLGYPFDRLVPSYATAIGSSADRPGALADLMGIIVNNGIKRPTVRIDYLEFAADTPWHTMMIRHDGAGTQMLDPAITTVVKRALADIVANGTAKRAANSYKGRDGKPLEIGGKTGTGDHRFNEYGAGGRLISSRAVNRTATFVFFLGNRFFGTITAHVPGLDADKYVFTSAMVAQLLKSLAPSLQPLLDQDPTVSTQPSTAEMPIPTFNQ